MEIQTNMKIRRLHSRDMEALMDLYEDSINNDQALLFISMLGKSQVYAYATGEVDGMIGILEVRNVTDTSCEIGYRIRKSYRHQGYATRGIQELCTMIQDKYGHIKVIAKVMADNMPSIKALEKNEFQFQTKIQDTETFIYTKQL